MLPIYVADNVRIAWRRGPEVSEGLYTATNRLITAAVILSHISLEYAYCKSKASAESVTASFAVGINLGGS